MPADPRQVATLTSLDATREYVRRGWAPVPVLARTKKPSLSDWPSLKLGEADLPQYFGHGEGVGLILGSASAGLVDVDVDMREAAIIAQFFLPETGLISGRPSKPASHRWYVTQPAPSGEKFADIDGSCIIELRSTGQHTVVPPSIHPSREGVRWEMDGQPAHVPTDDLRRRVRLVAAAALLARHWPAPGRRNDAANALAGMLLRAGWAEEQGETFIAAAAEAAGDEELGQRLRDVVSTAKRLMAGQAATGTPTLASIMGDEVVGRARQWLGLSAHAEASDVPPPSPFTSPWPEPMAPEGLYGLAGEVVHVIEPDSEADPAALLLQTLIAFGNVIGRGPFFVVEQHRHFTNLFGLVVGITAKSRKGTSWARTEAIFGGIDAPWASNRIHGGVGSGEGIIWHVRDPILKHEKLVDDGISDKRLMILETEFGSLLAVIRREGSTVSEVLRRAWDGTLLQTLTKNNPARATGAHISVVGHITRDELLRHLDETEIANGLANRFVFCCARRSKALPEGGVLDDSQLVPLVENLRVAVDFARGVGEMKRDTEAAALWHEVYADLSEGKPGLLGAVISRAEAQVLRLSMLFALLDRSQLIRRKHLIAALAVWDYTEASARHIFGDALGDRIADEILRALRAKSEGLTRTEVRDLFGRHCSEREISRALGTLVQYGLATRRTERTTGRPVERWFAENRSCDKSDRSDKR